MDWIQLGLICLIEFDCFGNQFGSIAALNELNPQIEFY